MNKKTILIVDDEEKNIKLIKGILGPDDYTLVGVLNGEDAIKTVPNVCPDCILLDIMMPVMNGYEVCRILKSDVRTSMIPIIMVTALSEKENIVKTMAAGADDFLSKPVDSTELRVRVKSLLRIKAYYDALRSNNEEIIEKNEKLHALERKKEELTNMIIHDLRSPLMVISGGMEMLSRESEALSENQRKRVFSCIRSCEEIDQLIQNLLDIHKMEEGKLQLKKEDIDMIAVAADVVSHFSFQAARKGILLSHTESDHLPFIPADLILMKRVLSNLLNNAIRHTPENGSIVVSMSLLSEPPLFELCVKDTGTGVEAQYREKIFDKFQQTALKDAGVKVGSSGLGLAFCKMAVEAHGGRIWVESEGKGKGSTFVIQLPVNQNSIQEESVAEPADDTARKARVLIIDDEVEIRQLLYDIVISHGHHAEVAADGSQGLELFKSREFDLVCTDLGMPGISGWQVAEEIKHTGKKVPVVVISGWSVHLNPTEMQEKGVNIILQKPFQVNQIVQLVQEGLLLKDRFEATHKDLS